MPVPPFQPRIIMEEFYYGLSKRVRDPCGSGGPAISILECCVYDDLLARKAGQVLAAALREAEERYISQAEGISRKGAGQASRFYEGRMDAGRLCPPAYEKRRRPPLVGGLLLGFSLHAATAPGR